MLEDKEQTAGQRGAGRTFSSRLSISAGAWKSIGTALNRANRKFSQRFRRMEKHFGKEGRELKDVEIEEMENCWNDLKPARLRDRETTGALPADAPTEAALLPRIFIVGWRNE